MQDMNTRFTEHVKNVLTKAYTFALQVSNESLEPIHLMAALASERGSVAADLMKKYGLDSETIREFFVEGNAPKDEILLDFSEEMKSLIEKAARVASKYKHSFIGTEHILFTLTETKDEVVNKLYKENKVDLHELQQTLELVFEADSVNLKMQAIDLDDLLKATEQHDDSKDQEEKALEYFARELTDKEVAKDLDYIQGRDKEIDRLITILNRRQKNNPILLGHPGVGKTAIVEHIAKLISQNKAPKTLQSVKIYEVDLAGMIAGTVYRGEFEERIKQLIEEAEADEDAILFIDELHTIIGAGANSGTLDAANILKPALARGKLRCIGATTTDEYKKHIVTDQAFARRFQEVRIHEPSAEETVEMLQASKKYFENFHEIKFPKATIEYLVKMADRHVANRYFPDKAVDLLDEVAAKLKMQDAEVKKVTLKDAEDVLKDLFYNSKMNTSPERLLKKLGEAIKYQEDAVASFVKYFYKNKMRNGDGRISVSVFGPEKSGKSHFVSEIADSLFNKSEQLHIHASDYKEKHSVSSLIGTSAGYIGYKDAAKLSDFLQHQSKGVVVIHEIDKAGDEFRKIIRSLIEGKITAGDGTVIPTHRISLICSNSESKGKAIGFGDEAAVSENNELTVLDLFEHKLNLTLPSKENITYEVKKLGDAKLKALRKNLSGILVTGSAKNHAVKKAATEAKGLSDIEKLVEKHLIDPIINAVLENETAKIRVGANKDGLSFTVASK